MVEQALDVFQAPAQRAGQMAVQVGVDIAAARTHYQTFQRRKAHAGVAALAVHYGTGGATIAQVRGQPATVSHRQAGNLCGPLAYIAVAGAVKTVAAHALLTVELLWEGVTKGMLRHALVKSGVEHGDLGQLWIEVQGGFDAEQICRIM